MRAGDGIVAAISSRTLALPVYDTSQVQPGRRSRQLCSKVPGALVLIVFLLLCAKLTAVVKSFQLAASLSLLLCASHGLLYALSLRRGLLLSGHCQVRTGARSSSCCKRTLAAFDMWLLRALYGITSRSGSDSKQPEGSERLLAGVCGDSSSGQDDDDGASSVNSSLDGSRILGSSPGGSRILDGLSSARGDQDRFSQMWAEQARLQALRDDLKEKIEEEKRDELRVADKHALVLTEVKRLEAEVAELHLALSSAAARREAAEAELQASTCALDRGFESMRSLRNQITAEELACQRARLSVGSRSASDRVTADDEDTQSLGRSSCGVMSSVAESGRSRILQGGSSWCSSAHSESDLSSTGSRPILSSMSVASSIGSESAGGGKRASRDVVPRNLGGDEMMRFAQALKPLLVTRKDIARVLSRVPEEALFGPAKTLDLREILETVFRSVVVVANVQGGTRLAFSSGLVYDRGEAYDLGRLQTSLRMRASPHFLMPAVVQRPQPVQEDGEAPQLPEPEATVVEKPDTEPMPLEVRLAEVSTRDYFLAELLGPCRPALSLAMTDPRCNEKSLARRRRALRHAKDALSLTMRPASD
eukprot:TRINITY_DN65946_c0_g1_i1.p1 TRINITY_DN65946_c0_g1~~TRINITY_DN65946_c0_g1_i1.p1  ORF type:complete len:592 (-),score=117.52 TRINITY_DN65946_c0_g1_i1:118-1893(-)